MSITIDFDSVDMRDVETLAMLIDDFVEPDYTKILDIIVKNEQFEEFTTYYFEINGSPFVKRQILSTTTTFSKEFDVEEGWPYLGDKEIDEDDFLPSCCIITNEQRSDYSSMQLKVVKEYSYVDDSSDDMDIDAPTSSGQLTGAIIVDEKLAAIMNRLEEDFPQDEQPDYIEKGAGEGFAEIVQRLENDFPQKSKRIKRVTRWAPVILKKPVIVGGECIRQDDLDDAVERINAPPFVASGIGATPSVSTTSEEMEVVSAPCKRKIQEDADLDGPILHLKRKKSRNRKTYYEASYVDKKFIIVEDHYRVKSFSEFSYVSHFRAGRFHILSQNLNALSAMSYVNDIGAMMAQGSYSIE